MLEELHAAVLGSTGQGGGDRVLHLDHKHRDGHEAPPSPGLFKRSRPKELRKPCSALSRTTPKVRQVCALRSSTASDEEQIRGFA